MLDSILRLALAMHSSKGVYALLLGSGVSRSSAIPTGWEIVLDLIRKFAVMKGESCEPDPEAWYKALSGADPDYSDILDQISSSSAERGQLLRSYFEPSEDDREQGRKAPSAAHRNIAGLVAKGYIRVIITTNFDRLMEQALVKEGVQPTVISTTDAANGAMPLTHSPCTVIKVHGDYLDSRLRNTKPELSTYEKPFDDVLDRVFDEFGLLISGWSAGWDVALCAALERCPTHRFGTYWTACGKVTGEAEKVISVRRATVVPIKDADSFFMDLAEKIRALEDMDIADPISARVAVARMKRYLADPQQRINLHDLVSAETERVYGEITSPRLPLLNSLTSDAIVDRFREYEHEMNLLLSLLVCGGYWASEQQASMLCGTLRRLADDTIGRTNRIVGFNFHRYPATLALYGMGLAAVANSNYGFLKRLLNLKMRTDPYGEEEPITEPLSPLRIFDKQYANKLLPERERNFTPVNDYIFDVLRSVLREYVPDDRVYADAFDWFEYLLGLVHCDLTVTPSELAAIQQNKEGARIWGPIGRFLWRNREQDDNVIHRTEFEIGGPYPEAVTAVLHAGMFSSSPNHPNYERFLLVKRGFDILIARVRAQMGVW